jgi:hypothetical protein
LLLGSPNPRVYTHAVERIVQRHIRAHDLHARAARRAAALLDFGPIILCRDYLPVPVSLQPGVGPDESLNALGSIGIFPDAAFATVKNGEIIPEKMDFYFTETALAIRVLCVFRILNFLLLCVSGPVWSRPLEIVGKRCLDG